VGEHFKLVLLDEKIKCATTRETLVSKEPKISRHIPGIGSMCFGEDHDGNENFGRFHASIDEAKSTPKRR
jgi:hypothetical protein